MPRKLADEEKDLLMRLAGRDFAEIDALREQIECATVEEPEGVEGGAILEFFVGGAVPLQTQDTDLGDGGCRDADGVPIVITLLQKDGYIWRLDISRADGEMLRGPIDYAAVACPGFRKGLSLEWPWE